MSEGSGRTRTMGMTTGMLMATETIDTVTVTAMEQRIVTGTDPRTGMPTAYLVTDTDTTTATLTTRMITPMGMTMDMTMGATTTMAPQPPTERAFTVMTDSLTLCFPPLPSRRRR